MRVLHVVGSSKYGGGYEVIFSLCEMAREHGCEPYVLTSNSEAQEQCRKREIGIVPFRGIDRPIRPWKDLWDGLRLAHYLRNHHFELIHTHVFKGGLIGRFGAYLSRQPMAVVHTHHGLTFHEYSPAWFRWLNVILERIASRWCDYAILMNETDLNFNRTYRMIAEEKVVMIPNGIPGACFKELESLNRNEILEREGFTTDAFYLGNICRFEAQKNLKQFVDTLAAIKEVNGRPVRGILVGDGDLRQEIETYAARAGVSDRISFTGFRSDRFRFLKSFDVFLTTSKWEGMSISLLEAMAAECAIVATDIRGNRDCIRTGKEGILVEPCNVRGTVTACRQLLVDAELRTRISCAAKQRFYRDFTDTKFRERVWEQVYKPVFKKKEFLCSGTTVLQ